MKSGIAIGLFAIIAALVSCSESFLDIKPKGYLDEYTIASEEGIDDLLIGAYSMLDGTAEGVAGWEAATSNWLYGSVRGMEANYGTDAGNESYIPAIQRYVENANNPYMNIKWISIYESISRCNNVIRVANNALKMNNALNNGPIDQEQYDLFVQQAKALRGWFHFDAWRMWAGMVPYIDENTDPRKVTNTIDIRQKIIDDLTEGTKLPENMGQIGRFNKTVSQILLAKAYMQMYDDYQMALGLLEEASTGTKPDGGPIGLADTYPEIFEIENRNGIESVYTVQYSVNDGSGGWNGGYGEVLNFPYKSGSSPGGCCGFFQPNQEFVNSFRTSNGLPLLDHSYNEDPVLNDQGLAPSDPFTEDAGPLDPRLDWTVGRRGIPYWDWGEHTGSDWIREQSYAGPYSPKKQVYKKSDEGIYTETGSWTSGWTANGYRMIRFADLLLMIAECQIETGDFSGAREKINLVRRRATNPSGYVMEDDGITPAANYRVNEYASSGFPFDTQENARKALQMERKLELGMEGHRWFDLNRWGNTVEELNRVLEYERTTSWGWRLYWETTVGPEDTSFPIPQRQIDLSLGNLKQIPGHIDK